MDILNLPIQYVTTAPYWYASVRPCVCCSPPAAFDRHSTRDLRIALPVADRVRLPAQVTQARASRGRKASVSCWWCACSLRSCDRVDHCARLLHAQSHKNTARQRRRTSSAFLLTSAHRQSTVRPYSLVMFMIKECPGTVLEEKNYEFLQGIYRSFTHTHQPWT